ncbi:retrotransposon protein, putative, ty1-copia subclass [Tanacetum coccineum]
MDGNVHTYKARLVAKGFTQLYEVDYEETFSPIANIRAIRILIAIAAFYDYEILQMDVETVFLNGYLDEDIYMVQPEGFVDPKHPRKVCKLQKSIYGLKQASISWNKRFYEEIKRFGFTQNLDEPCVYQKASGSNVTPGEMKRMQNVPYASAVGSVDWKSSKQSTTATFATEAEYITASEAAMEAVWIRKFISGLAIGNHIPSLQSVKTYLGNCSAMKDLGKVAFILGIKINRDRSKRLIRLSQSAYMDKILKRYRMDNSKRGYIPMQEKFDLNKTQGASTLGEVKHMQNVPYASAVGSIINPEVELRVDCYCNAGFEIDRD